MAAADFPSSPTVGQTYSNNGRTWTYTSAGIWDTTNTGTIAGDITVTGNSTIQGNETVNGSFTASNYDVAGKNKIINGGMDIWQRGTTPIGGAGSATTGFLADRWQCYRSSYGINSYVNYITTATLPGFSTCLRFGRNTGDTTTNFMAISQTLESKQSIPLAGQPVTYSFYVRVGANYSGTGLYVAIVYGTGTDQNITSGFTGAANVVAKTFTNMSTGWQRLSVTGVVPTNATQLAVTMSYTPIGTTSNGFDYFDITGAQLELGSVATPFSRAGGTIQGELAACQRYYWRHAATQGEVVFASGPAGSGGVSALTTFFPVTMRAIPSSFEYSPSMSNFNLQTGTSNTPTSVSTWNNSRSSTMAGVAIWNHGAITAGSMIELRSTNNAAYIGFSAEL